MKLICNLPIYFLDFEIQSHSQARPNLWIADPPFHIKYRVKFRNKLQCREDIYNTYIDLNIQRTGLIHPSCCWRIELRETL